MSTFTKYRGLDASHFQGDELDMHAAKAAGISFWFEKATEALSTDPTFLERQPRIRATFAVRGWYHFLRSEPDAVAQGQHFAKVIGPLVNSATEAEYAVFDLESGFDMTGEAGIDYVIKVIEAFQAVNKVPDDRVIIYGSHGWLVGQFGPSLSKLVKYHLWAARYNATLGSVAPWSQALIWQNSEFGTVEGVGAKSVDLDGFNSDHWPLAS